MFQVFVLLLFCEVIILLSVMFFISNRKKRFASIDGSVIKFNLILLVIFSVIQFIVLDYIINPKTAIYYDGILSDKQIKLETESYSCGKDNKETCYRTVKKYYLTGTIYNNKKCEIEVSSFDYHKAKTGERFTCRLNEENYILFNKDYYKTSSSIRENKEYAQILKQFKKPYIFDNYKFKRIYYFQNVNSVASLLSLQKLDDDLQNKIFKRAFDVKIVIVKNISSDFYPALMDNWKKDGIGPNEIIVFYGIDNDDNIIWNNIATFAKNDSNLKLTADFITKHINVKSKLTEQIVSNDLDWILKNYVAVSNSKFEYLKETRNVFKENITMFFFVIIYAVIAFFVNRRM